MGSRGPVGKRLADLQGHRSKSELSSVSLTVVGASAVHQPEAPDYWCAAALRLWESMGVSGQSRFYEPSDWAYAWFLMDLVTDYVEGGRQNGQLLGVILSGLTSLLLTEGDRRRVGVELSRAVDDSDSDRAAVSWAKRAKKLG